MQNIFSVQNHRQSKAEVVREVLDEFCSNSTIHGVRYLTDQSRHWSERTWWILSFSLSLMFCGLSMQTMLAKWYQSPIVIEFPEKEATIAAIPFPTVTICPETKANKNKFDIFSAYHAVNEYVKLTEIERSQMEALHHICDFIETDIADGTKFTNESIYEIIQDIALSMNSTFTEYSWQSKYYNASEMFSTILTADGVCFQFNALNSHDIYTEELTPDLMMVKSNPNVSNWSMEMGYKSGIRFNDYPIRVFNAKNEAALILYPHLYEESVEYLCRGESQGFKVVLGPPGETIKMNRRSFRVPLLEQVDILIKPTLTYSEEALRNYPSNKRNCFYGSERKLRFYKHYAQSNCRKECLGNFTVIECGCVKFSMPRDTGTKICGIQSIECYKNAEHKLYGEDVTIGLADENAKSFREKCNCLPACLTILYDAEVDRSKFDWEALLDSYKDPTYGKGWKPSKLTIRFKDHNVKTLVRTERYTLSHLLSICGGLLGVFLGISVLSIIEFFYFSTLRLFWTIRKWNARNVVVPNNVRIINSIPVDFIDRKNNENSLNRDLTSMT